MKKILSNLLVLLLGAVPCAHATEHWAYESALEFFTTGDFDGDTREDLVVADKVTGSFRVALQLTAQNYAWSSPANCGFTNVTSLGSGRLVVSNRDALAFTTPAANRVQFMSLSNAAAAWLPGERFLTNTGPYTLTALEITGTGNVTNVEDLYLGSVWNGATPNYHATLRNTNSVLVPLAAGPLNFTPERANAVRMFTNQPLCSAVLLRGGAADTLLVSSNIANTLATAASVSVSGNSLFVAGLLQTNSGFARFLVWKPGATNVTRFPVTNASPSGLMFAASNTFNVDLPIAQILILPGASSARLLVFHANLTTLSVYNYDGTTNPPTLAFRTNAPAGETFSGALPIGSQNFIGFTSNDGSGRTTTMRPFRTSGGSYTNGAAAALPSLDHFAGQGNVLLFKAEPFVNNNPVLVSTLNAGDWSSSPTLAGNVVATRENYLGESSGLGSPGTVQLGAVPAGVTTALANQRSNSISIFSLGRPFGKTISEISIAPNGGIFDRAVTVTLSSATNTDAIKYRLNNSGAWLTYATSFTIISNTTLQAYGQPAASSERSAVRAASFTIRTPVGNLDSDGDGVPDYVEKANGLDPTTGGDSDGDAYSDLEELVNGTNPNSAASQPTNSAPLSLNAGVTLEARPNPRDYLANAVTKADYGTLVRLHDVSGGFIGEAGVALPAVRAARFANVVADPSARLLALVTQPHFNIDTTNADSLIGRELLTLVPPPVRTAITISNFYSGTNDLRDASNWVVTARSALSNSPPATLAVDFTRFETLSALLVEKKISGILMERTNTWGSNLTLFAARALDAGRTNVPAAVLLSLEQRVNTSLHGYRLKAMLNSISNHVDTGSLAGVPNLKTLVSEIYRVSGLSNNAAPGVYPLPADVIRQFLAAGTVQSNYAPVIAMSGAQLLSARSGVSNILAAVPARPETNLTVTLATSECAPTLTLVKELFGQPHLLVNSEGLPFTLPQSFTLLPASELSVTAYTDAEADSGIAATCRTNPLEVISVSLTATPVASDPDTDGNLLIDTWERAFFGGTGFGAFQDSDSDGYQDMQEMLEGTDPGDGLNIPPVPAVTLGPVQMRATRLSATQVALRWTWPSSYAGAVDFGFRAAGNVAQSFTNLAITPSIVGDEYTVVVNPKLLPAAFFRLTLQLH